MQRRSSSVLPKALPSLGLASIVALAAASALVAASCGDTGESGSPSAGPVGPSSTGSGAGGAGGAGGGVGVGGDGTGRSYFESTVEQGLMDECGACHQLQGAADAPFLAAPDIYGSIISYPGVIVRTASSSILLTHPADPSHGGGQAPDMSPALREKVLPWLELEASLIPEPETSTLTVTPFKPKLYGAFNTIYLGDLGPEFENVSITFNATELGDPPSMLQVDNLEIHPIADMTIHVVHPIFTVYTPDGDAVPDPADSFSSLDDVYSNDTTVQIGTGEVIHTQWTPDSYLGIAFADFEIVGGFIPPIPCKNLSLFQTDVKPQVQFCATTCHGGANAQAMGAMDLSKLGSDDAAACLEVRARTKPGDPDNSQILIVTSPLDPSAHLYKFMGSISKYNMFKTEVSPWILSEQ
jgi:hypothetical protein